MTVTPPEFDGGMLEQLAQIIEELDVEALSADLIEATRLRDLLDAKLDKAAALVEAENEVWFTAA